MASLMSAVVPHYFLRFEIFRAGFALEGRGFFPGRSRRNRLRRTHFNGNPGFRNASLMRLAPWETVPRSADARPRHRLPVVWACDELRRPLFAAGLLAPRCATRRPSASLRAAQIIRRSSGPFPRLTKRARGTVTLRADPRPADVCWTFAQPPWELRGGFASANFCRCHLAGARPRSIGAVPGKERERCSLSARRCACAALTWGANNNGIFRAVWP